MLAQDFTEGQVKAAILLRLFAYFEWPNDQEVQPYTLGIYKGDDDVSSILLSIAPTHRENGRAISAQIVDTPEELSRFHLIYIPQIYTAEINTIALLTRRTNTLIVSDGARRKQDVMVNFTRVESTISFEINRTNIIFEHLSIDSEVLKLGGTELDIAELYKGMESALDGLKVMLESTREQFQTQNTEISALRLQSEQAEKDIVRMRRDTTELGEQVRQKNAELQKAQSKADTLSLSLLAGRKELGTLQSELLISSEAFNAETEKLEAVENRMATSNAEVTRQNEIIKENQGRITQQALTLENQEENLRQQGSVISSQKQWLIMAAAAITAILFLMGYILRIGKKIRHLNDDLSKAKRELEDRVKSRTTELEQATKQAIQASQAKSNFLSNISHELRTPLNAIIGFSSMMKNKEFGKQQNDAYSEYSTIINKSGDQLLSVIDGILDLTRIEDGELELNETLFCVATVIQECVDVFKPAATAKSQKLHLADSTSQISIHADKQLFSQMILSLLSNASKFSADNSEIFVTASADKNTGLKISIQDQGIGIADENISIIIQPFVQVESALNKSYYGVGLGLSIVSAMVHLHDGELTFNSTVGEGTIVTLQFPATRLANDSTEQNHLNIISA